MRVRADVRTSSGTMTPMKRRRSRYGALTLALACAVAAACGTGEVVASNGLKVLIAEPADAGDDALLSGTLQNVGGCLGIDGYAVIWPDGTRVGDESALVLDVPGFPTAVMGERASVGGGVLFEKNAHPATDYSIAGVTVPGACVVEGVWMGSPSG